jgi:hypothetical protein
MSGEVKPSAAAAAEEEVGGVGVVEEGVVEEERSGVREGGNEGQDKEWLSYSRVREEMKKKFLFPPPPPPPPPIPQRQEKELSYSIRGREEVQEKRRPLLFV